MTSPRNDRRPLWWGARAQDPTEIPEPAALPESADVLVVGAGLTGLSTAVLLARSGRSPVVIEARRVGAGTSGHSSAKVSLLQGGLLSGMRRHASAATVRAYVEANRVGQQWLLDLLAERGVPVDVRDAIAYAVSQRGAARVASEHEAAVEAGLAVTEAGTDLPFPVRAAIMLPDQAQIDPVAAAQALRDELVELGVPVVEGVRATGVSLRRPWTVDTSVGGVSAQKVVLATQIPILDRSLHFARVSANRSYVLAYPAELEAIPQSMSLSLDGPARSLRTATDPSGQTYLLVGGNGHPAGRGGSAAEHVAELDRWAHQHFPIAEAAWSWSAQDYHLTTHVPSIGAIPGTDGSLLTATGFDKWGMALSAGAGHILTADILGEPTAYAEQLRADGIGLRDVGTTAALGAATAARLTGGRVAAAAHRPSETPPAEGQGRVEGSPATPTAISTVDGRACRVTAVCPHLGGILAWNDAERTWDCPLHGSRFDPDGTLIEGPATTGLEQR
ncbi:MAG: FAD-dependent oxidoreductase [Micrococcales bacterium]|nr:FAD-dependent oxidoreductase [Micrococcales bacterium]